MGVSGVDHRAAHPQVCTFDSIRFNEIKLTSWEAGVNCAIYKSDKKLDYYLYVEREDDFSRVPKNLLSLLGSLEFVMAFQLSATRKLAQADVDEVIKSLQQDGYYLQSPPRHEKLNFIENNKLDLKF